MNDQKCKQHCPHYNRCNLKGDVDHVLHICNDRQCKCHSAQRYADERKGRASRGYIVQYVALVQERIQVAAAREQLARVLAEGVKR